MSSFSLSRASLKGLRVPPGIGAARLLAGDWWKEEDLPIAWDRLFPGGPLRVEVGFGGGEFLLEMARRSPGDRFIGIEKFGEGHRRLMGQVGAAGFANVLSLLGDAYIVLNLAFAEGSLASVTVNFSDPWPKNRHARNRLLCAEFFGIAARKLARGGRLICATDDVPYAHQASKALEGSDTLASIHPERAWRSDSPHSFQTRYERKWIAEGRPLHYFVYERIPNPAEVARAPHEV